MVLGNNINELNGLAVCAAGGSNMRLVLPPPLQFLGLQKIFLSFSCPRRSRFPFSVMFGLDPDIQVKQGIKNFLDPRVYSSLALGHEDDGICGGVIW